MRPAYYFQSINPQLNFISCPLLPIKLIKTPHRLWKIQPLFRKKKTDAAFPGSWHLAPNLIVRKQAGDKLIKSVFATITASPCRMMPSFQPCANVTWHQLFIHTYLIATKDSKCIQSRFPSRAHVNKVSAAFCNSIILASAREVRF